MINKKQLIYLILSIFRVLRFINCIFRHNSIMTCKGTCNQYKAQRTPGINRYVQGQKMCSTCEIFVWWDDTHCPCCNCTLRTRPRNTKNRRQLQMIQVVQRI